MECTPLIKLAYFLFLVDVNMRQPRKSSTKKLPRKLSHINQLHFANAFPRLSTLSTEARGSSPYERPLHSSSGGRKKKPPQCHDLNPPFNDPTGRENEGANTGDINMPFSMLPALSVESQHAWNQQNFYQQYGMDSRATGAVELGNGHNENPAWSGVSVQNFGYDLQDQGQQMSVDYGASSTWQQDNPGLWEVELMLGTQRYASTLQTANNDQWYPDHNQVNEYWATSPAVSSDGSITGYFDTPTPFSGVDSYFSCE